MTIARFLSKFCFVATLLVTAVTAMEAAPRFQSLGRLRGGGHSEALAISASGGVVAGVSEARLRGGSFDDFAFLWQPKKRMRSLGTLGGSYSEASGISADGTVIVGGAQDGNGHQRAFRWTSAGMVDISTNENEASFALGVSTDGSVVVGWVTDEMGQEQPFRWSEASGLQTLPTFGGLRGFAADADEDGSIVIGYARNTNETLRAFRWTEQTGMVDLGDLGGMSSQAHAITPSNEVIVGESGFTDFSMTHAFRWTPTNGMEDLGLLPGGANSVALDVSADGTRIVGIAENSNFENVAALWTREAGWVDLNQAFRRYIPRGWSLRRANAISADGRYIVGEARNRRDESIANRLDTLVPIRATSAR